MPERRDPAWEDGRLDRRTPVAIVELALPMGNVYFAERPLSDAELSTAARLFSASVKYAGTVKFKGGWRPLDNSGRLLSASPVVESSQPFASEVVGPFGRVERRGVVVTLANGTGAGAGVIADLLGQHYVLGRTLRYFASFPGLDTGRALVVQRSAVKRVTLTATQVTVEAQ